MWFLCAFCQCAHDRVLLISMMCLAIFLLVNEWHTCTLSCLLWMGSVSNCFIVLQDPAVALAKKGYHVLLEKPMVVSACHKAPCHDAFRWLWLIQKNFKMQFMRAWLTGSSSIMSTFLISELKLKQFEGQKSYKIVSTVLKSSRRKNSELLLI